MSASLTKGALRLALFAAGGLVAAPALAQSWGAYPPPPPSYPGSYYGQDVYMPPAQGYAPQQAYPPQGGYAPQGRYGQTPNGYNPYAAQRPWQGQQQQAYQGGYQAGYQAAYQQASIQRPSATSYVAPPEVAPPVQAAPAPAAPAPVAPVQAAVAQVAPAPAAPVPAAPIQAAPVAAAPAVVPAVAAVPAAPAPLPAVASVAVTPSPVVPIDAPSAPPQPEAAPAPAPTPVALALPIPMGPPAPVMLPHPALPPAPSSVALSYRVVESASAYLHYIDRASALSPAFTDGVGVAKELKVGAAYEPKQFEEGAIAYAAIEALQEPAFVNGVRQASGGDPDRAAEIAADLLRNPASAVTFNGADAAAARASAALRRQGDRLLDAGAKMKQAAYDVQHAAWSKGDVVEPDVRLAAAKTLSATRVSPEKDETDKLMKVILAEQGGAYAVGEGASPAVSRGLALAALAVLGQAGEDKTQTVASLMAEEKDGECLKMAKLNLFQCLAVAGPHYEDVFCLGQHAMMETAQCMIKSSGVSHPVMTASAAPAPAAAPAAPTAPAPQDYMLPVAGGSSGGAR